jgi:hypothetical protein
MMQSRESEEGLVAWRRPADSTDARPTVPDASPAIGRGSIPGGSEATGQSAVSSKTGRGSSEGETTGPGASSVAGNAAPRQTNAMSGVDDSLAITYVDISRAAGDDTAAAEALELRADGRLAMPRAPEAAPPAEAVDVRAREQLSPVLRAYVSAYLDRIRALE